MHQDRPFLVWFLFVVLTMLWGCSYFLMKKGMEVYSPLMIASVRIASAGLLMLPWSVYHLTRVPKNKVLVLILSGFFGNGIPAVLFCLALKGLDTNLGGILNALTPIWVLAIGILFFNKKTTLRKALGVMIGFAGICILFLSKGKISTHNIELSLYIVVATMLYGLNINLAEAYLGDVPSLYIGTVSILAVGIIYTVLIYVGIDASWAQVSYQLIQWNEPHIYYGIALGVLNTALSNILFYELVKIGSASFASMVTYIMPFVTIIIALFIGETIMWESLICLGMILTGVYMVRRG